VSGSVAREGRETEGTLWPVHGVPPAMAVERGESRKMRRGGERLGRKMRRGEERRGKVEKKQREKGR